MNDDDLHKYVESLERRNRGGRSEEDWIRDEIIGAAHEPLHEPYAQQPQSVAADKVSAYVHALASKVAGPAISQSGRDAWLDIVSRDLKTFLQHANGK